MRILVVEDNAAAKLATQRFFSHRGHDVRVAKNHSEAIAHLGEFQPELLITDWDLGNTKTGVDVARDVQDQGSVRTIFVTGHDIVELKKEAADLESLEVLQKPVNLSELARLVDA